MPGSNVVGRTMVPAMWSPPTAIRTLCSCAPMSLTYHCVFQHGTKLRIEAVEINGCPRWGHQVLAISLDATHLHSRGIWIVSEGLERCHLRAAGSADAPR